MQYSQEHLKTMVYAEFGGQTECIMGNWKIENTTRRKTSRPHGVRSNAWMNEWMNNFIYRGWHITVKNW